ncbi:MAG: glutamate--tRNA ligase [Campylobacter sp.]
MYRFAPSPTGDMHLGNLRVVILNYLCSLQDKSGFIIRIEDTDKERNIPGKDKEILEILTLFGIKWDTLYYQSENLKFHRELAAKLMIEGKAFACFCTQEELEEKKLAAKNNGEAFRYDGTCEKLSNEEVLNNEKPFVIRMKKPLQTMKFTDAIKGEISFEPENVDSFVIMRADKTPTYNFACATDDMLEGVTFVIRGEDHVSNTPKQDLIREGLGYTAKINYAHLPIILNIEGKKMSKRENESSVKWMLSQGFMPEALANYIISLGYKAPVEIFTIEEAAKWFDISKVSSSPAKFDIKQLEYINREHIKLATDQRLAELMQIPLEWAKIAKFYTQESSLLTQIKQKVEAIFGPKDENNEFGNEMKILKMALKNINFENFNSFDELKKELMNQTNLKGKSFFMPLRLLITNAEHGPELSELYPLIKPFLKEILK